MGLQGEEPLVGRAAELAALHGGLDAAIERGTTVALVEAPAGYGKSALLRRFGREVEGRATLIRIAAAEGEQQLPFGLVQQLWSALARVSADIRPTASGPADHRADPLTTGAEILEMALERIAGPVVVLADDLHWADGDSLQAMTFALRRLGAASVLAVGAFRPWPELPEALRRLALDEGRFLRLGGLDESEVAQLAGALDRDLPVGASARIVDHTLGSPLHIRAVLDEVSDHELAGAAVRAPRDYSLMVMAQFARCSPPARDLVLAVAVLGSQGELELARELAGTADLPAAVDDAVRHGLLECDTNGIRAELRFTHPLVRSAIYDQIEPVRRLALHERAARLTSGPASVDHAVAAVLDTDAELAGRVAAVARQDALGGAPLVAASRFRQAARLSPEPEAHRRYLLRAVEQLLLAGDLDQSAEVLDQFEGTSTAASPRYLLLLGTLSFFAGDATAAQAHLQQVWEGRDEPMGRSAAAMAAEHLAHLSALQGRGLVGVAWARRSLDLMGDEAPAWATAGAIEAVAQAVAGRHDEAEALLAAWPPIEGTSLAATGRRLGRGLVRLLGGGPEDALDDLRAVAEHPGHRPMRERISALSHLAEAEARLGRLDEAVRHGEIALALALDSGYAALEPVCRAVLGAALVLRGQPDEAAPLLGEGAPPHPGDLAGRSLLAHARALAALGEDDLEGVVRSCEDLEREVAAGGIEGPQVLLWRPLLAEALLSLGRVEDARAVVVGLAAQVARSGRPGPVAEATVRRLEAGLALAEGRGDDALRLLDEAVGLVSGVRQPFEVARTLECRGRARSAMLGEEAAGGDLREAADAFARLGAPRFAGRVRRLLEAAAVPDGAPAPPPSGASDHRDAAAPVVGGPVAPIVGAPLAAPTALTPKEEAVAALVVAGRSNREVAAELFVSVKTVEYHLGNIYAKVGVRSRTELAAWWHAAAAGAPAAPVGP